MELKKSQNLLIGITSRASKKFFDYYKYYKFVINVLDNNRFDKLIVFGLQMTFFLNRYLIRNYSGKYIIDIRDYNNILKIFNPMKVIEYSAFTVISSPGYIKWLPKSDIFLINHNTQIKSFSELVSPSLNNKPNKINISYIGAIRDLNINIDFINSLANNKFFDLYYHGEGDINNKMMRYLSDNYVSNVVFTGRYERKDEANLYLEADFINVLRYNDNINNYTALPNRLYNAALYGKPMIALRGTYLAELIEKYTLGLVLDSFMDVEREIVDYLRNFNREKYELGRFTFFEMVIKENQKFKEKVEEFI